MTVNRSIEIELPSPAPIVPPPSSVLSPQFDPQDFILPENILLLMQQITNGKSWDCQVGIGGGDNRLRLGCLVAAGSAVGLHREFGAKTELGDIQSAGSGVRQKKSLRPQRKSNKLKDKVMSNNSQVKVKKTQAEVHPRIPSVSKKMKSITACKDSLNSKTLNANAVCATCNKCLFDSNNFACVTKMLNDVNARTKKPNFAPILGYGDLVQGNVTINRVYYVEGLNHNLFSVGQFCDADLDVAFWKSTCFVRDLQGNDLLTADSNVPSHQGLDLLFGPLYDEFFNTGSNLQDKQPTTNIPSTSAPSTPTYVHAEENTNDKAEEEQLQDEEFTNPFCAPTQEVAESFSHNIEQVRRNPSRPVQTRRQLATDPEMCMYALTVSTTKPKNIKEAMTDSAWIEAMYEELHQFDRLRVWELVDKPFDKMVIRLKWL
nr:retrotransposon protein, putative, unclassified [Tanacetum cinerariifolium]